MKDLKLNECGDLAIENGDLVLVEGTAEVVQRILIYIRTGLQEYFFDLNKGVPYVQRVYAKNLSESELKGIFRLVVQKISGVKEVPELIIKEYNANSRTISIDIYVVIEDTLEVTTVTFNGVIPDGCDENITYPKSIDNLEIWLDAQYSDLVNRAKPGYFTLRNDAELRGSTELDLNNRAIIAPNDVSGTTEHYINFLDTPFIANLKEMTFLLAIRVNELSTTNKGLFSITGYEIDTPPNNLVYNFAMRDDGASSRFIIERRRQSGTEDNYLTISSFENSNFVLAIKVDDTSVEVFKNGESLGSFTFNYFTSDCYSSGKGYIFCNRTWENGFLCSMNAIFGEFLMYNRTLEDVEIKNLSSWLLEKWNMV